ncbi:MAG: hypothetical protein GY884_02050 [Proteobacteria bacterium]|nr:hypothetical protein [Pseudomonadota bacterium]
MRGDVTGAVVVDGVRVLATVDDELVAVERSTSWLRGATSGIRGVAQVDGGTLVLVDDGLVSLADVVSTSPLDAELDAVALDGTEGAAVVMEAEGVFAWQNGRLRELETSGARRGVGANGGMVWVASGGRVYGIEVGTWAVVDRIRMRPDRVRVDAEGTLWTTDGDTLERGRDAWVFPEDIDAVQVCNGAWVHSDGRLWRVGETVRATDGMDELWACDALGRALVTGEDGLARVSDGRPIGFVGVPAELDGDTPFSLEVTGDGLADVAVDIDGKPIKLEDMAATIDALEWFDGADHLLSAAVLYDDGSEARAETTFRVADLGQVGFATGVEPIYDAACSDCHADGTETELAGYDNWVESFDVIVSKVEGDAMPLGRDPLTGAEKATIKAWGEGGFSP